MTKKISKVMQRLWAEKASKFKKKYKHKHQIETIEDTFDISKFDQLRQKYGVEADSNGCYLKNEAYMEYNKHISRVLSPYEDSFIDEYVALYESVETGFPDDLEAEQESVENSDLDDDLRVMSRNTDKVLIHRLAFYVNNEYLCLAKAGFLIHLWCKPVLDAKGAFLSADEFCDWLGIDSP